MVFGDVAGPVSQMIQEHRYRRLTSHGVSLRPRRTPVKRSLGRDRELSYASMRRGFSDLYPNGSLHVPALHAVGRGQSSAAAGERID
jgi:hypothetical protein